MAERPHTKRIVYQAGYTAVTFELLVALGRILGRRASLAIGRAVGGGYAASQPEIVEIARKNLALLGVSDISNDEAKRVFVQFAETLAEYLWLGSRTPEQGFRLAEFSGGLEHLQAALASGTGAILATGHFGFFEFGALVLGKMGFPVSIVTYPEPTDSLTRWRADYRRRWGAETIELAADAFSSLRVNEALERGRFTAMLVDRPVGGRSLDVDLPGGQIAFSMAPAILSWMSGCAVVPVDVRRTPGGLYAIRAAAPIWCDRELPRNESIEACTRQIAAELVAGFQKDPSQWYHFVPLGPATK